VKKFLSILFIFAAGAVSAQQLELKEVITRSARGIEETLPQRAKVIVLNFESSAKTFSDYVLDELSGELIEGKKITVVDRRNLSTIMDEMKFQYSGYVSDESMISIGKMLGAQAVISGSLTDMGTNYRFRIRIISVETAAVQRQISLDLKKDAQVAYLLGNASAQKEMEKKQKETEKDQRKTERKNALISNMRNNWLSLEASYDSHYPESMVFIDYLSIGVRYERMFNPYISLGANGYFSFPLDTQNYYIDLNNIFAIDAFFRFYPFGKLFFMGIGIGYHFGGYYRILEISEDVVMEEEGFALFPEIGFKIEFGKEVGFFIHIGFSPNITFGTRKGKYYERNYGHTIEGRWIEYRGKESYREEENALNTTLRSYLGVGWAF